MSEAEGKTGFKKRAHRPWETSLLEKTVQDATLTLDENADLNFNLDLDSVDSDDDFPEFNFLESEENNSAKKFSHTDALDFTEKFGLDTANLELKNAIVQTQHQQELLLQQVAQKNNSAILLGGFFQPQQLSNVETSGGRKLQSILTDLKDREQKLTHLTNDLKISEAVERAKQAELTRKAEEQQRHMAETRLRETMQQANIAADQFRTAMDQANQAVRAHQEEEQLRLAAEEQAKEARLRANEAELNMQNERLARLAAEDKAHQAMLKAEHAVQIQRQLQDALDEIAKLESTKRHEETRRIDLQQQHEELQALLQKTEEENRLFSSTIRRLEAELKNSNHSTQDLEQKINELTAQRDKLKEIIASEQDLRKLSERSMRDAQNKVAHLEQSCRAIEEAKLAVEQQLKVVDERAKRAIAHASRTVMHLLYAPRDSEYSFPPPEAGAAPTEKLKIKVPADASLDYELSDEDFKF